MGCNARKTNNKQMFRFIHRLLYSQEINSWYLLNWRVGGFQADLGDFREKKNLLLLPGIEI
jgi:hypothetical protein